jgi:hypothetical protein
VVHQFASGADKKPIRADGAAAVAVAEDNNVFTASIVHGRGDPVAVIVLDLGVFHEI